MLITPSFKKSLIVKQFQGNCLNLLLLLIHCLPFLFMIGSRQVCETTSKEMAPFATAVTVRPSVRSFVRSSVRPSLVHSFVWLLVSSLICSYGSRTQFSRALLLMQFSARTRTPITNTPSTERSFSLLNTRTICVIFLYN